jgi:hypothetical protein
VRLSFLRGIRHPFYPALKPAPAAAATDYSAALYGAFDELLRASETGARVGRAIFPLRHSHSPFLSDSQRDTLWDRFEVPIYALLLDAEGDVVGYECEAQDGMHIRQEYAAGLLPDEVESKLCECGRPGPRLMPSGARLAYGHEANVIGDEQLVEFRVRVAAGEGEGVRAGS